MLTEQLVAQGHPRIDIIVGMREIEIARRLVAGHQVALANQGIAMPEEVIVSRQFQSAPAFEASLQLIDQRPRPTAVIATSNHTTIDLRRRWHGAA